MALSCRPNSISLLLIELLFFVSSLHGILAHVTRFKRDFMYISDVNGTDANCFENCNSKFKRDFEFSFNLSLSDFYDFPFHPLVLDYSSYLLYCKLSEQKTRCYIDQCNDLSADSTFSPANFICAFKRSHFTESRQCLAEVEPITFLKCDQQCHDQVAQQKTQQLQNRPEASQVFLSSNLANYEAELDMLCSFQACYLKCMMPIVKEVCGVRADRAIEVVRSFVESHADDISDWHVVTGNFESLPNSCRALSSRQTPDQVLQIINAA